MRIVIKFVVGLFIEILIFYNLFLPLQVLFLPPNQNIAKSFCTLVLGDFVLQGLKQKLSATQMITWSTAFDFKGLGSLREIMLVCSRGLRSELF